MGSPITLYAIYGETEMTIESRSCFSATYYLGITVCTVKEFA